MRNIQSLNYLISVVLENACQKDEAIRLKHFNSAVATSRRHWAICMAHGPYEHGSPNLYIQETLVELLRLYVLQKRGIWAQIRIHHLPEMLLIGVSTNLPPKNPKVSAGMVDIHEYSHEQLQPDSTLYVALLPNPFDLANFDPVTSTDIDDRDILRNHIEDGGSLAAHFQVYYNLAGEPLREAWEEGRKLLNKWTLKIVLGEEIDPAALYFIDDDFTYQVQNRRQEECRIGKADSYVDSTDLELRTLIQV